MQGRKLVASLALASILLPGALHSYITKSVFLFVIDGARNQEVFEDPTHSYAPHIWNDLAPLGTIYTNFYTLVRTSTTPGHLVFLSGVRNEFIINHEKDLAHFRSRYPTVFEYYRSQTGIPADSVWIVSGKKNLNTCDWSLHPSYGPEYGATMITNAGDDTTTYETLLQVIESSHPRLMLINLRDVDKWGHVGTFEEYTRSIQIADSLVFEFYNNLQSDPFYAGNVTLLVTTDHGRIDDAHGGYHHHGLGTHGDRNCFFVALGPDIKEGEVVDEFATFMDIAPTIGELLGFETPFAEGRVMAEMLREPRRTAREILPAAHVGTDSTYVNLSTSPAASLFPSLAVAEDAVHVVWSEEDTASPAEDRQILYVRSEDAGNAWSTPEVLFQNNQSDGTMYRGDIFSGAGGGLIATVNGYYGYTDELAKRTYKWFAGCRTSSDGTSWNQPQQLRDVSEWKVIILNPPRAALDSLAIEVDWITESRFTAKESVDGGNTFTNVFTYLQPRLVQNEYLSSHDLAMAGEMVYYATERNNVFGNEIYVLSYDRVNHQSMGLARMDPDSTGSFRPCLGTGNGTLHVVWCDLADGGKGIYHRKSTDSGESFSAPVLVSSADIDAWNPDLAVDGDTIIVVWEDYTDRWGEIYSRRSTDGGDTWEPSVRETFTSGFSVHPRVESREGASYLTWQDRSSGNWEVLFKQLPSL